MANNTPEHGIDPQLQADIDAVEAIVDKAIEAIRKASRDGVPRILQQAVERMSRTLTAEVQEGAATDGGGRQGPERKRPRLSHTLHDSSSAHIGPSRRATASVPLADGPDPLPPGPWAFVEPVAAPFNGRPPKFNNDRDTRVEPLPQPRPAPNTRPSSRHEIQPRYGQMAARDTVATFRYKRPFLHLRQVGIAISVEKKRGAVIVGVVRRSNEKYSITLPEWVVTGSISANGKTSYRVRNYDIEGTPMEGAWAGEGAKSNNAIAWDAILARGYVFPPFDRLLEADRKAYLDSLAQHDQPPERLPGYC